MKKKKQHKKTEEVIKKLEIFLKKQNGKADNKHRDNR